MIVQNIKQNGIFFTVLEEICGCLAEAMEAVVELERSSSIYRGPKPTSRVEFTENILHNSHDEAVEVDTP